MTAEPQDAAGVVELIEAARAEMARRNKELGRTGTAPELVIVVDEVWAAFDGDQDRHGHGAED